MLGASSSRRESSEDAIGRAHVYMGRLSPTGPRPFYVNFLTTPRAHVLWTGQDTILTSLMDVNVQLPLTRVYCKTTVFNPEEGGKILLRNSGKIAYFHTVLTSK
jgi:hypothetical protein